MPDPGSPLRTVDVPVSDTAAEHVLPALATALSDENGPAILPLPLAPDAVRSTMIEALQPDTPAETADVAMVVPTSGSTGEPKGVLLSRDAVTTSARLTHERLGGPGRWLLAVPATHIAGLMVLARSVVAGTTPAVLDLASGFDPEAFVASARPLVDGADRCYVSLVPRQLRALLDAGGSALETLAGFDAVLIGGAATPPDMVDQAQASGVGIVTTYGMTETAGGCVYDGRPLDGVRVRTDSDGRIQIAGPTLATGYRLRPDLDGLFVSDIDGRCFATAALGSVDEGVVHVAGRADDVAVSGGVNVPLEAVDRLVAGHAGVREALAAAVPDRVWGERVVVGIVAADPSRPPTLASIRDHVTGQAAAPFAPQEIVIMASVPVVPGGKPDRRAIAAAASSSDTTNEGSR